MAPDSSVTVPVSVPVVCWAVAGVAQAHANTSSRSRPFFMTWTPGEAPLHTAEIVEAGVADLGCSARPANRPRRRQIPGVPRKLLQPSRSRTWKMSLGRRPGGAHGPGRVDAAWRNLLQLAGRYQSVNRV